jgi:hypothetical protein
MRRVLLSLLAAAVLLGGLAAVQVVQAPPAHAGYVTHCSGDVVQANHTTAAGNYYEMKGHVCLEVGQAFGNPPELAVNTRWHGHCRRNGAVWDGCRVNTELVVEVDTQFGWQDRGATAFDIGPVPSSTSYFADSSTYVSFTDTFADGLHVRAKAEDEDNMRFLLADGTTVLKDMSDLAGPAAEICSIDPC